MKKKICMMWPRIYSGNLVCQPVSLSDCQKDKKHFRSYNEFKILKIKNNYV